MLRVAARVVKPAAGRRQLASLASLTQSLTGENTPVARPLSQPFGDLKLIPSKRSGSSADAPPQVTTLDNGVRVASIESSSGVVANVAVHVSAGSRVGPKFPTGIALLAARAGFLSTTSRSDFAVQRDLGAIGAKVDATATRGAITYSGSVAVDSATDLLAIIADTVHNSRYRKTEVGNVAADLANEIEREADNRDIQLDDALHAAAYQNNTLGRPLWPTKDQIAALDVYALEKYTDAFYTPARTVVLGSGVPHEQLVRAAKELFNDSAFPPTRTVTSPSTPQYTGGDVRISRRDAHLSLALGFKNAPENSADVSALRVLQMWLEGPRTFAGPRFGGASAGGVSSHLVARTYVPGKLQAPAGVVAVGSAGSRFADGGVLALGGLLSKPSAAKQLIDHLVGAFKAAAAGGNMSGAELEVAKAQTIAEIYDERSAIEELEILAQQVVGASVASKAAQAAKIEAVTEADITRVARQLLSSPVSVAAYGDVSSVPRYDEIAALFK